MTDPDPWGTMFTKMQAALDEYHADKLAEEKAELDAFVRSPDTRSYVVGLPVLIYVNDAGRVHYEIDTSEASSAMNEGSESVTPDQLTADMLRVDMDHDNRIQPTI